MVRSEARDLLFAKAWMGFLVAEFACCQALLLVDGMLGNPLDIFRALTIMTLSILVGALVALPFWRAALRSRIRPSLGGNAFTRIALMTLWGWNACVWIQLWIVAWLRPIYDWDGLYYHIPAIHGWMRAGHIAWVQAGPDIPYVNGYPMGMEALSFLGATVLGTDRLLDAANLLFWPIGAFALYVVARRLGSAKGWSLATAAALSGVPILIAQSTTAYVDPAFGCAMIALFAAGLELLRRPHASNGVLMGMCVALVIATKGLGIPFALFVLVGVLVFGSIGRSPGARRGLVGALCVSAALGVLFGGGWVLRNVLETGNPVHPVEIRLGAWTLVEGIDVRDHIEINMPPWLSEAPAPVRALQSWIQPQAPITHYGATSGLGFVWVIAGLPAILALIVDGLRRRGLDTRHFHRARPFLFLFAVALAIFLWQPGNWWARFTIWLHAIGLPCFALVMTRSYRTGGLASRRAMGVLCTLLVAILLTESSLATRGQWIDGLRDPQGMHYYSSAEYVFPGIETQPGFDQLLQSPRIARSELSRWGVLLGGVLAQPAGAREIVMLPVDPSGVDIAELYRQGYQIVLWDVEAAGPAPQLLDDYAFLLGVFSDRPGVNLEVWELDADALNDIAR